MFSIEDLLYPFLKFYNKTPLLVRNFIGMIYRFVPFSIRYGDFYNKYFKRIKFFVKLEQQKIKTETDKLLIKQINYAIYHIPFYQKFTHIVSIDELSKLPIINKIIISENFKAFLNPQLSHKGLKSNTGGSSGTPFSFFIEKGVTRPKEAAHFNWYWKKYGYKPGAKVLMIRGKSLRNNADFEYQAIGNKLVVSCYNLNQESIKEIHNQIAKFNPKFIHAYPSSLLVFTKELQLFLNNNPLKFKIETIFLGSENLFDQDKIYFETFYNSKVVNWYGHSECLIHGGKCELSGDYHFYPFYGYLELVDEKNSIIEEPGIEGRIVATGFDNSVMPLVRYDTGDIGIYSYEQHCECGFKGKSLAKIVGRGKDYIVLIDGTQVTLTAFIFGQHHEEFGLIKEMQLVQNKPGEMVLRIVPLSDFPDTVKIKLQKRLIQSIKKDTLQVQIEIVKEIEKTHRGKHRLLIQNITQ